ncbi:MAG: hypothetical protein WBD80_11040, partial [Xanthobacteraceae bacterium]
EYEDRQRQENDGVYVEHVGHFFQRRSSRINDGSNRPAREQARLPALCKHATEAIQWPRS